MELTTEQILALAPDPASAKAGTELADARSWQDLGRSSAALWGQYLGRSALYKVRVDLKDATASCSCPSRKFPCKHGLGLMLLAAQRPGALPDSPAPPWVAEWLAKRESALARREARADSAAAEPASEDPAAAKRRQAQAERTASARERKVASGLATLDIWLDDLVRNGLAGLETKPARFWEDQAARMVDAQSPGVAARMRALAALPNATPDWPDRLLAELGRLALLSEAYAAIDALDQPLADEVRTLIGWTLKEEEVVERGEAIEDDWIVLGERTTSEDRLRVRCTWLLGAETRRTALALQYATSMAGFSESFVAGTAQRATVVYWPGTHPRRALVRERSGRHREWQQPLPGAGTIADLLQSVAAALACQPWLDRFPSLLGDVVPVLVNDRWLVQDANGDALALVSGDHWMLLALSGGSPVELAGEWDGRALRPFGVVTGGRYHVLPEDGDAPAQDSSAARSTGLSALASVALAGTARAANTPPAGATALDELFAGLLPRNRERSLLLCAAVEATQQLAGYVAPAGVSLPAPAPPEQLAACSPGVARIVGNMLAGEYRELLPEALRLLSEARLRLPHALLPAALAVRYSLREAMLPVVGERGRWLGGFNPTWSWVTESSDEGVSPAVEALWQTGARWQRLAALRKARAVDPALGRSWIEAVWRQEKAEFRAGMLELVGEALVSDDEPLLERALDDRAQTVTTIAADLLARMPGSALVERMRRRADTLLRYEPPAQPSGLRATLRSVFGGSNARGVLHVSLPEALPDDWLRDCIDPFPPAGRGERAWWLAQTLAVVPPVHWSSRWALEPATLLDLAAGSDEGVVVIDAWMRATARHPANEWSTAFWQALLDRRFDKSIGNVIYRVERYAELLATLPRHDAEQFVGVFIDRGNSSWEYLKALPAPWSDAFGQRWLDAAYTQLANPEAKGWDRSLEAAAGALPPACFERALELQTLGEPHISAPHVKSFLAAIKLRQRLYRELTS